MRRFMVFGIAMLLALPVCAQRSHFSLHIDLLAPVHLDPVTEARRAEWNSPLGRVRFAMAELQGSVVLGGVPRGPIQGVIGLKAQRGVPLRVITSALESGLQLSESSIAVIHWPWEKGNPTTPLSGVLPLDRQLSILLGHRLGRRPPGSK